MRLYAIRSTLTARVVLRSERANAKVQRGASADLIEPAPHSVFRLQSAIGWTAALEGALRNFLRASPGPGALEVALKTSRVRNPLNQQIRKQVVAALRQRIETSADERLKNLLTADSTSAIVELVGAALSDALPPTASVYDLARERASSQEGIPELLPYLTLAETAEVLDRVLSESPTKRPDEQAIRGDLRGRLEEFRELRNALAHLRVPSVSAIGQLDQLLNSVQKRLCEVAGVQRPS